MKKLTTPKGAFGPYTSVETLADRYRVDGADLPFTVVGQGTITDWTGQLPEPVIVVDVPQSVDMAQARLALLGAGIYASAVDALIAAMPSPQREAAQIEWEFRSTVRRGSDLVLAMAAALQLTDRQVDDLFTLAATL